MSKITNYRKSWIDFKKTSEYKGLSESLKGYNIKQPYRDNILMGAFAAGWGNRNIDFIETGERGMNNPNPNNDQE